MRYTNNLPSELKKVLDDALARINQERDKAPSAYELAASDVDVELWVQTWGSTALGFGGIGGQAITGAYTFLVWNQHRTVGYVYFSTRFAYRIAYPFSDFFRAKYAARQLPAVRDAHKLTTKRYEGADPGTCGIKFGTTVTVCGRRLGHTGEHDWHRDCNQCKGVAGYHEENCYLAHPTGPKEKKR